MAFEAATKLHLRRDVKRERSIYRHDLALGRALLRWEAHLNFCKFEAGADIHLARDPKLRKARHTKRKRRTDGDDTLDSN